MLVLSRRPQQSIMIGDEVVVTVLEVKGDQVRLGITAPRTVPVYREEVLVSMAARASAGNGDAPDANHPISAPAIMSPSIPAPAGPVPSATPPTLPQPRRSSPVLNGDHSRV